jgi:two-component system sensor histidine kinase KdpD
MKDVMKQAIAGASGGPRAAGARVSPLTAYALSLALVAAATVLAFVASRLAPAVSLPLIYVLPVVIAASLFGWGPSLLAIVAGVLAYDFFFTRPYLSFRMTDPDEIWAAGLLLVTSAIVSTVAAQARRRARDAETPSAARRRPTRCRRWRTR